MHLSSHRSKSIYGVTVAGSVVPAWVEPSLDPELQIEARPLAREGELIWRSSEPPAVECRRTDEGLLLSWAEASYLVGPNSIVIDAADPMHALERHLNSLFSLVLADRGVPCLHGLVMTNGIRSIAILARSGSGKSTTGRALADLGWQLVTDDLIGLDDEGRVRVGPPFVRIEAGPGTPPSQLDPGGKVRVPLPLPAAAPPLTGIAVLDEAAIGPQRVTGIEAVDLLLNNVYNPIVARPEHAMQKLAQFAQLASNVPVLVCRAKSAAPRDLALSIVEALA